jgi:anaerobic C4-dicarboxylate transporter
VVAMIALFGIAWMADTFIANNEDAIVAALGSDRFEHYEPDLKAVVEQFREQVQNLE